MPRSWIFALSVTVSLVAQGTTDPTGCSLNGLQLGNNPDCNGIPRSWQWPLQPNACYRASVLGVLGERQLAGPIAPFSFVTGHTDPVTGREFALLSSSNGFTIIDAHDISRSGPTRMTPQHWFYPEPGFSVHRGSASYGEFVYESNAFRPSLRVWQVSVNPSQPSMIAVTQMPDVSLPAIGTSYRLTVDQERGHLYVPTINGLFIYDVNGSNGGAPVLLAVWQGWLGTSGVIPSFDVHIQRDGGTVRAVVSEYLTPGTTHISILDVTTLPPGNPAISPWMPPQWCAFVASVPGAGNAHSAWMPKGGDYIYSSIGDVATVVYDMRGFTSYGANAVLTGAQAPPLVMRAGSMPSVKLQYPAPPLRHMGLQGLGYTGYVSSWQEGFILYDLRPGNTDPNEILAQVDTSAASSTQSYGGPTWNLLYPGAFSVYRLQDSGVIYVSDETNGLFFVRANVGHVHRFGKGAAEPYNGKMLTPRITAEYAPMREQKPWAPDPDQRFTISDLVPGRAVILLASTAGLPTGVPFPDPASPCRLHLGGFIASPIFLTADAAGRAEVAMPPVLPAQFRVFLQAFAFVPNSTQCSASSRGTWFGLAERE